MEKPAPVDHAVHELIRDRWSPRAFSPRPIDDATMCSLLEAARWASSCYNEQPWRFIVSGKQDAAEFARLLDCLVPGNQAWAGNAAALMLTVARKEFERNDKPNRHAWHDVGLAAAQLAVQATALGLRIHQMAGIDRDKARETYGIPEGFEAVTGIAIGYPADPADLAPEVLEREQGPRVRKPLRETVFAGAWGKTAAFLG